MRPYAYIGPDDFLAQETALGREEGGDFLVQVDRLAHPWSTGWHEAIREDWVEVDE